MQRKVQNRTYFYKLLLLFAAIIWGSSFVVFKNALSVLPPAFILTLRFSIAFLGLFIICFKKLRFINKKIIYSGIIIGAFMTLSYYFQNVGLKTTTPGKNAFLTAAYSLIVPFLYWFIASKKPDGYNIIAAVLCISGIGLVSLGGDSGLNKGDYLTLFSALFVAMQIVSAAILLRDNDVLLVTLIQFAFGAATCLILHFLLESPPSISDFSVKVTTQIAYLGIFATLICLLFQNIGQKHTPPSQASIILSLEAVFGVIFSVLFFGERPTLVMSAGFLVIFLSLIVSETKPRLLKGGRLN